MLQKQYFCVCSKTSVYTDLQLSYEWKQRKSKQEAREGVVTLSSVVVLLFNLPITLKMENFFISGALILSSLSGANCQ